ncbi:uncharacterized protein LOC106078863 [Biomphalaria glabrata]|uniref:Uncharacterized protein LOC106078863 n=1 Tax=Biomphalaria glabrata TaxID=6526 RepID=A0A9W3BEI8_BIOGL|nr:uncharacterized protein LOC106078863 [Biomphalaria glabrata]XP_055897853.1 uncharacterized protein LOC106078863 [Biomphalaria glabrata]
MSQLCKITRSVSVTIAKQIQICSRTATLQSESCPGITYPSFRSKSYTSGGKGYKKNKFMKQKSRSSTETQKLSTKPTSFFQGKGAIFTIDKFSDLMKKTASVQSREWNKPRIMEGVSYKSRFVESSKPSRNTDSAVDQVPIESTNRNNINNQKKNAKEAFNDIAANADTSIKNITSQSASSVPQSQTVHHQTDKSSKHLADESDLQRAIAGLKEKFNRLEVTKSIRDETNKSRTTEKNTTVNDIPVIKPTVIELVRHSPIHTSDNLKGMPSSNNFKSKEYDTNKVDILHKQRDVILGSNFILMDQKSYINTEETIIQPSPKTQSAPNSDNENADKNVLNENVKQRPQSSPPMKGFTVDGPNVVLVDQKPSLMSEKSSQDSKLRQKSTSTGPIITNSTDSISQGNNESFILVDNVERTMIKKYGRDQRNFVLKNDNPHVATKYKNDAKNSNRNETKTSLALNRVASDAGGTPAGSGKVTSAHLKAEGEKVRQKLHKNVKEIRNANTSPTNELASQKCGDASVKSFESVIKDNKNVIKSIQQEKQKLQSPPFMGPLTKEQTELIEHFKDSESKPISFRTKSTSKKTSESPSLDQTKLPIDQRREKVQPSVGQIKKQSSSDHCKDSQTKTPKVSVLELKPDTKGTKPTEHNSVRSPRKKEDCAPLLYVKPKELTTKQKSKIENVERGKSKNRNESFRAHDAKLEIENKTDVVNFDKWSKMLLQRVSRYQELVAAQASRSNAKTVNAEKLTENKSPFKLSLSSPPSTKETSLREHGDKIEKSLRAGVDEIRLKQTQELKKDIQSKWSHMFKSKLNSSGKSDIPSKISVNEIKNKFERQNSKFLSERGLDKESFIKSTPMDTKPVPSKRSTNEDISQSSSQQSKDNIAKQSVRKAILNDSYPIEPDSKWKKIRQAIFNEDVKKSKNEGNKLHVFDAAKRVKNGLTLQELNVNPKQISPKPVKIDKESASKIGKTSVGHNHIKATKAKTLPIKPAGVLLGKDSNFCNGSNRGTNFLAKSETSLDELKSQRPRYLTEKNQPVEAKGRSKGSATARSMTRNASFKSASSLSLQSEQTDAPRNTCDTCSGRPRPKAAADDSREGLATLGEVDVSLTLKQLQGTLDKQKQILQDYEKNVEKYELALKRYKAMLSLAQKCKPEINETKKVKK